MPANYGFSDKDKYYWRTKKCPNCKTKFETRNPRKKFCSEKCRVAAWVEENGQNRKLRKLRHELKDAEKTLRELGQG